MALLAAAAALQLAEFELDSRMLPAIVVSVGRAATLRDGLLLLDVREPGPTREFRLRFVAALIAAGIGSIGIVQDFHDPVHEDSVGSLPLYPSMAASVTMDRGAHEGGEIASEERSQQLKRL
jgi:hypothetical protein